MRAVFIVVDFALDIYIWLLLAVMVLSWIVDFGVVDAGNRVVARIGAVLRRVTEPAQRPVRLMLPKSSTVDISPAILIIIIVIVRYLLAWFERNLVQ